LIYGHNFFKEKNIHNQDYLEDCKIKFFEEYDNIIEYLSSLDSRVLGSEYIKSNYFISTYKNTNQITMAHSNFFSQLNKITEVFILGHSLGAVDIPYFQKIMVSISNVNNITWNVSFHRRDEKNNHIETLISLGIPKNNIRLIEIAEYKDLCS